jgi:hypothetical protein
MTRVSPSQRRRSGRRIAASARVTGSTVVVIAAGFAAVAFAEPQALAPKLTAEQVVARNAAARGGLDAWRKVQTMVWVGHIESSRAPVPGMQFVLEQQRPNRTRFEIDAMGQKTVRVFDGAQGWKLRGAQNGARPDAQPYTPEELKFARAGQGVDGPLLDSAAKGTLVTLEGLDEIEGRKAFRLEVRLPAGERDRLWIDAKTFLDIRYDRVLDGPGPAGLPRKVVTVLYRDYKTFDGLKMPTVIETAGDARSTPDRMVIERVVVNTPLEPRAFVMPVAARLPPRIRQPGIVGSTAAEPERVTPSDASPAAGPGSAARPE